MLRKIHILVAPFILLISACVPNSEQDVASSNAPHTYTAAELSNAAVVSNTMKRNGVFDWQQTSVFSIDNKLISSMAVGPVKVAPGPHKVTVQIKFNKGLSQKPQGSIVTIPVMLKAGNQYHTEFTIDAKYVSAWIADSKNTRVSKVEKAIYEGAYS